MNKLFKAFSLCLLTMNCWAGFPAPSGFVVDNASLLTPITKSYIAQKSTALAKNGGAEVAVVTVRQMDGMDIETYSIRLAELWKVGKKGKDNGIIILVALSEKKIRIEVGRGLEGVLNDAKAGRIIADVISPKLHHGDFDGGIKDGFNAVIDIITKEK